MYQKKFSLDYNLEEVVWKNEEKNPKIRKLKKKNSRKRNPEIKYHRLAEEGLL